MAESSGPQQTSGHSDDVEQASESLAAIKADRPDAPTLTVDVNLGGEGTERRVHPPVSWRELIALLLLVLLSDLTIYRGAGFAGYAALCLIGPLLIWAGAARKMIGRNVIVIAALLTVTTVKLLWCGSSLLALCGLTLLFAFAMALSGQCPYVLETCVFVAQTIRAGYDGLQFYGDRLRRRGDAAQGTSWLSVIMPLAALAVFGSIFILANPDLVTVISARLEAIVQSLQEWLKGFSMWEIVFWCASLWISVGLLRPVISRVRSDATPDEQPVVAETPLYVPFRNTLLTVIGLFAAYLLFELGTLWFREFPEGFYYSGYAHEGAAWLTLALALATGTLSLIFRGRTLGDPRLSALKRLAWLWSLENALLAVTVYHRLYIYIGFNGMSRMRVVGLLGITCVAVGFALVVWKILHQRRFVWLLRRQLWTVACAVFVYAVMPVDMLVHSYNVRRILAGDPAPSVQISVHPITTDGYLVLGPLLKSDNEVIREGVGAKLAEQQHHTQRQASKQQSLGWTAFQIADRRLLDQLQDIEPQLARFNNASIREDALKRFHEYAYQWY